MSLGEPVCVIGSRNRLFFNRSSTDQLWSYAELHAKKFGHKRVSRHPDFRLMVHLAYEPPGILLPSPYRDLLVLVWIDGNPSTYAGQPVSIHGRRQECCSVAHAAFARAMELSLHDRGCLQPWHVHSPMCFRFERSNDA